MSGMVMLVRLVQERKAKSPMLVMLLGMIKAPVFPPGHLTNVVLFLLYNTPSSELYFVLAESIIIEIRLVHQSKALASISVIPLPMVTLVRLVQSLKASIPMLVTLSGMVMEERLVQPEKACNPMLVTLLGYSRPLLCSSTL